MTKQADIPNAFDEKEWAKDLRRLKRANKDLGVRAKSYMRIDYFPARDYLYVTLSAEKTDMGSADYLDPDSQFEVAFYNPETFVIGGFDVPFFLERSAMRDGHDFWSMIASKIRAGDVTSIEEYKRYSPGPRDAAKLAAALQAVIDQAA